MRLIDADPLLKKTHNYYPSIDHYCCSRKVVELRDIIEAPTIEAEPVKHGRWIHDSIGFSDYWRCSACCEDWFFEYDPEDKGTRVNYCPNCGCKMDLEAVGCSMAPRKTRLKEFALWPKFYDAYMNASGKMLEARRARGRLDSTWRMGETPQDVMNWWLESGVLPGQYDLFDMEYEG